MKACTLYISPMNYLVPMKKLRMEWVNQLVFGYKIVNRLHIPLVNCVNHSPATWEYIYPLNAQVKL